MFDDVHFTGTINLGNIVNVVVYLIGAIAIFIKVKAELASHERKTGQKIETSIRKRLARPKKVIPPATSDQGDQGDQGKPIT